MIDVLEYKGIAVTAAIQLYKMPMFNKNYSLDELISEANLHLIRASKKFDESKGFKFTTFAMKYIKCGCYNFVRDNSMFPIEKVNMKTWDNSFCSIDNQVNNSEKNKDYYDILPFKDDVSSIDLVEFIDTFKDKDKYIITLFLEGYKQREIAKMMHLTNGYINKRMFLMRNRIKEYLEI